MESIIITCCEYHISVLETEKNGLSGFRVESDINFCSGFYHLKGNQDIIRESKYTNITTLDIWNQYTMHTILL